MENNKEPTKQEKKKKQKKKTNKQTRKEPKAGKMVVRRKLDPCRPDIAAEGALEARRGGDA
jgi:hypothetical protein